MSLSLLSVLLFGSLVPPSGVVERSYCFAFLFSCLSCWAHSYRPRVWLSVPFLFFSLAHHVQHLGVLLLYFLFVRLLRILEWKEGSAQKTEGGSLVVLFDGDGHSLFHFLLFLLYTLYECIEMAFPEAFFRPVWRMRLALR